MNVSDQWPKAKGKKEFMKHYKGESLTASEAILANCYDCQDGYETGKRDCQEFLCPMHEFMPYRRRGIRKVRVFVRTVPPTDTYVYRLAETVQ